KPLGLSATTFPVGPSHFHPKSVRSGSGSARLRWTTSPTAAVLKLFFIHGGGASSSDSSSTAGASSSSSPFSSASSPPPSASEKVNVDPAGSTQLPVPSSETKKVPLA